MKGVTYYEGFSKYFRKDGKITMCEFKSWRVRVTENGKRISLGTFKTEEEAIKRLEQYKLEKK